MAKRKKKSHSPANQRDLSTPDKAHSNKAPVTTAAGAPLSNTSDLGGVRACSPLAPPPGAWICCGLLVFFFMAIVFSISGLTRSIDDVKVPIFHFSGPVLMLASLATIFFGHAPPPRRWVSCSMAVYFGVAVASVLAAKYRWIGWIQLEFLWSAGGFMLAAHCVGAWRRTADIFERFLVIQLLLTTVIGCLMYDFTGSSKTCSVVGRLHLFLAPHEWYRDFKAVSSLLGTFARAEGSMQSTILNRDFFAGYCCLFLPFAITLAIEPGKTRRPMLWRGIGFAAAMLSAVCILACQSKGEYIMLVVSLILLAGLFFRVAHTRAIMINNLKPWAMGMVVLVATLGWLNSPRFLAKFKSLGVSIESRDIIWSGSINIFKHFPLLGGGPGSFRIYFPEFRSPDYFLSEISNVTLYSHNLFLDQLCEIGLLGFAAFMALVCGVLGLGLMRVLKQGRDRQRLMVIPALAGLVAIFGSNLSSPNGRWVIGACMIWTVMGLLSGVLSQLNYASLSIVNNEAVFRPRRLAGLSAVLVGSSLVIGGVVFYFSASYGINYFRASEHFLKGDTYNTAVRNRDAERDPLPPSRKYEYLKTAVDEFTLAIKLDPTLITSYYHLASAYSGMFRMWNAEVEKLSAKYPSPDNGQRQNLEQANNLSAASLRRAMETYEALETFAPDYAEIHYNLGLIYDLWGRHLEQMGEDSALQAHTYREKSLEHLDRMGLLSNKAQIALLQGQQYISMGDPARATEVLGRASRRNPDDTMLARNHYRAAHQAGDQEEIANALETLFKIDPADDAVIRELLEVCLDNGFDDRLEKTLARLEELNPVHPALFQTRANLARRNQDQAGVAGNATSYMKVRGRDLTVLLAGAEAAKALGEQNKSQSLVRYMLTLDPGRIREETQKAAALAAP